MKKTFNFGKLILVISLLLVGITSKAQNCSGLADKFVQAMNLLTNDLNKAKTFDEIDQLDFEKSLSSLDMSNISEECLYSTIPSADKTKIKNSISRFIDSLSNKAVALSDGLVSKAQMDQELASYKAALNAMVDESDSYMELFSNLSTLE